MKTIIIDNLTQNKTFKIKANNASVSLSQQNRKIPKNGNKRALSAVWKINNQKVLEIISNIKGSWKVAENQRQYTFAPQEPSNCKLIVYIV